MHTGSYSLRWLFGLSPRRIWTGLVLLVATVMAQCVFSAQLEHRYSFDTDASDSVGGSHGTVMGGAAFSSSGELSFDGVDDFVDLPDRILSGLDEVSLEAWITWYGGGYWQRIFEFGSRNGFQPQTYLLLTPAAGTGASGDFRGWFRATITTNGNFAAPRYWIDSHSPVPVNAEYHAVLTYSQLSRTAKLYLNGVQVAAGEALYPLSSIEDTNNWLGRSQVSGDPFFRGRFNEFRIYSGQLLDSEVVANYASGPNSLTAHAGAQVSTLLPEQVSLGAATLRGWVRPNGIPTTAYFEWGRTTNYGSTSAPIEAGNEAELIPVECPLVELVSGAIYHFRCVITNAEGEQFGSNVAFLTQPVIETVARGDDGRIQVQFNASAGLKYTLYQSPTADFRTWAFVDSSGVRDADGPVTLEDVTVTSSNVPARFYRLFMRDW